MESNNEESIHENSQESKPAEEVESTDVNILPTLENNEEFLINSQDNLDSIFTLDNQTLDEVILHSLGKIKECIFHNEIEERKLAEFILKILTVNIDNIDSQDFGLKPNTLDEIVEDIVENNETDAENATFNKLINSFFGPDTNKAINENLRFDKIDDIVEKLLGEDVKRMMYEHLQSNNLDDLLNKLIDEKIELENNSEAKHPYFDNFIDQILGKNTEEFLKQKLEAFINKNAKIPEPN